MSIWKKKKFFFLRAIIRIMTNTFKDLSYFLKTKMLFKTMLPELVLLAGLLSGRKKRQRKKSP